MMNTNFTRMASLIVAVSLLGTLFSGCSKPADKKVESTVAPVVKMETIRVWTTSGSTKELVTKMVDEYNNTTGKQKGIQIEYEVKGGDYKKVVDLAIAAAQAPELFVAQGNLDTFIAKGSLMAVEDMPGGKEFLKPYEGYLAPVINVINGKTYSIPFGTQTIGLNYNKDLFKKAGIVDEKGEAKPPKTWEEVRTYAKKMTNSAEKTYGIALPMKWNGFSSWHLIYPFISSIGHDTFDPKTGKYNFSDFKPVLELFKGMIQDKSIFPGAEGLDNDPARAQFAEGRIGMIMGAFWDVGVFNDQFPTKMNWGVAEIPVLDANNKYLQVGSNASFIHISSSAKESNLEKVMEVFKWFNSDAFITTMYEEGKYIPYKADIAQKAKKQPTMKGVSEYAGMLSKTYNRMPVPSVKLEGEDFNQVFIKMLLGVTPIEQGVADLDKRYNDALTKDVAAGTIDIKLYKNPNFDIKAKK